MDITPIDPEFVRVWRRVRGEDAPDVLADALAGEVQRRRDYLRLNFQSEAADCLARCRTLRALGFVHGGAWPPLPRCPARTYESRPDAVRALWREETDCAGQYRQWADQTGAPEQQLAFARCARSCERTANRLWRRLEG